jgi:hypothetical protein
MADVSQTAANVKLKGTDTQRNVTRERKAGETITQGQPYYISETDSLAYQTDANDGVAKAAAQGIAITPASANGRFIGCEEGPIDIGGTLVVGTIYVVSVTKGGIAPSTDLTTGHYVTPLGTATTSSTLELLPKPSGVQKP